MNDVMVRWSATYFLLYLPSTFIIANYWFYTSYPFYKVSEQSPKGSVVEAEDFLDLRHFTLNVNQ